MEKLTTLIHRKKQEILIPEIKTVCPSAAETTNGGVGTTDSKKVSNEESASTSHSINGDVILKTTPG